MPATQAMAKNGQKNQTKCSLAPLVHGGADRQLFSPRKQHFQNSNGRRDSRLIYFQHQRTVIARGRAWLTYVG